MKNKEVCGDFINSNVESKTKHLFIINERNGVRILYSYGYHFPIAVKLLDGNILFNLNGYSNTTNRHKGDLVRVLGFNTFKELEKSKEENFVFLTTEKIKEIIDKGFTTKTEITESKI